MSPSVLLGAFFFFLLIIGGVLLWQFLAKHSRESCDRRARLTRELAEYDEKYRADPATRARDNGL